MAVNWWNRFPAPPTGVMNFDVNLDRVAELGFLVAFPTFLIGLVPLGDGQPVQFETLQDPPHSRVGNGDVVIPVQIHGDLSRPKVVVLPQIDDLSHHLGAGGVRAVVGPSGSVS